MKIYIITTFLLLFFLQANAVGLMNQNNMLKMQLNTLQEEQKKVLRFLSDSFSDYFKLAIFENILNSVGHNLFKIVDSNSNGVVEQGEFEYTLSMLGAPHNVATLLFTISDADASGFLDFGEYLVALEIFVRKALGTVSYSILETNGLEGDLASLTELWADITSHFGVDEGLTRETYEEIFKNVDGDKSGVLNLAEFTQFSSALAVKIKTKLRRDLDHKISSYASICASNDFVAKAEEHYQNIKVEIPQATDAEEIIAKILTRATISAGHSEFASWSLDGGEGCNNPADVAAASLLALQERTGGVMQSWSFLENSLATGAGGLGFGLFDNMRNFLQMNRPASGGISNSNYDVLLQKKNTN